MSVKSYRACAILNFVAGGVLVVAVTAAIAMGAAGTGEVWVYAFLGVLCLGVGGMLWEPRPGAVTILALPVGVFAGLVAGLLIAGGWAWEGSEDWTVTVIEWGGIGICLLQLFSVVTAWRAKKRVVREATVSGASGPSVEAAPPPQENA